MTTHDLARLLLSRPDEVVMIFDGAFARPVNAAHASVPVEATDLYGRALVNDHARDARLAAARVTLIDAETACPCCLAPAPGHRGACARLTVPA